jgi:cardiolipin synthase A/B
VKNLEQAIATMALELHPDRMVALSDELLSLGSKASATSVAAIFRGHLSAQFVQSVVADFGGDASAACREVGAMLRSGAATARALRDGLSQELVWTGPTTGLVPIRHTEQVLTGLINGAQRKLFIVSFVAFAVPSITAALCRAAERGVAICILLERIKSDGGTVNVDSLATMKAAVPKARLYIWTHGIGGEVPRIGGSVHAKCAVADGREAFITSANLTEAAMERNIELGVLLRGGPVPIQLELHLDALIASKQLSAL